MKIFNLTQYAAIKAEKYIKANCGGRYKRKEAIDIGGIGIGRLRYVHGIAEINNLDTQERFRANLETFKNGLGIYVRSLSFNFLLVIPSAEIKSISISKKADKIKAANFSWTRKLMNIGLSYPYARIMLLDHEIEETNDIHLNIGTTNMDMRFLIKRYDPKKIIKYFEEGPYTDSFDHQIEWYVTSS